MDSCQAVCADSTRLLLLLLLVVTVVFPPLPLALQSLSWPAPVGVEDLDGL